MNPETPSLTSPPVEAKPSVGPSPSGNGGQPAGHATPPGPSRLPRPKGWSTSQKLIRFGGLAILVVAVLVVGLGMRSSLFGRQPFNGPTWKARKERLKITIVARGTLESAKNSDVYCTVRSGTKGSTSSTIIKWIIDEGEEVKKGDKLMELDSSGFQDQLKDKNKDVDKAYADKVGADEQVRIQEIANESAIEAAKNARDLAKIELEKYREGDYVQALKDIDGKIETANSDLADWKDRAAWSARMVKKGLLSKVQADADSNRVDAMRINLENYQVQKKVLEKYTRQREIQDRTAKLAEAARGMKKAEIEARSNMALKVADRRSKDSIYQQELARKKEIEDEIKKCIVLAPQDGLVVYYVPEQVRGGGGSQQSVVAQGEPVREGQKMIQIPDLSKMLVSVRVPEAFMAHLHNPTTKDHSTWQMAQVKVDSFSKKVLKGHVKSVATVASKQDWFASDVMVYKTMVSIHETVPGLKPGMSAEVTIFADESKEPVLVVPVQAVLGTISMGAERKVFVVGRDRQPVLRDIVVGMTNERVVEVTSGLEEGDEVVLAPQSLLKEDSDLRPGKVKAKQDESGGGPGGEGKKGGKKGGAAWPGAGAEGPGGQGPGPGGQGPGPGGKGPGGKGFGGKGPAGPGKKSFGGPPPG
jgi:multidrug efflux pump subunit AcrA (membrane-fusion protein)